MYLLKTSILVSLFIYFLLATHPALGGTPDPQETVKSLLHAIKNITTGDNLPSEQIKNNQKNSRIALSKLNIPGVGSKTLGKHWKKRTSDEQKNFLNLLRKLFEKIAFPNSGKFFSDLDITYGVRGEKKGRAVIPITVIHKNEGEVDIEFILENVEGKWLVVEVILDEVSMRNNLRSQFYKIIKQNSYQELIRRMTNKLKNAEVKG